MPLFSTRIEKTDEDSLSKFMEFVRKHELDKFLTKTDFNETHYLMDLGNLENDVYQIFSDDLLKNGLIINF